MELSGPDIWTRVLDAAREALPEQSFRTWLAGTHAVGLSEDELLVEAPSQFHVEWIEDKYGYVLSDITERVLGRSLGLSFRSGKTPGAIPPLPEVELTGPEAPGPGAAPAAHPLVGSRLNERYTFDRFVVGNNNQLAAAASHAVAERPGRIYNPLFLYGGVGLGKTHLMHAIGNYLRGPLPEARIAYVPTEQFTNEMVLSIQEGTGAEFRRRYRQMDLLLVDDIHFLEGKERTQEEFFHTFNQLYELQKQIVITSDCPPREIPALEERLRSRFEWGLIADIQPPDLETKVAILRKKAEVDGVKLPDEVTLYVASKVKSNIRELEGCLVRLTAYASLVGRPIDLELATECLKDLISEHRHAVTVESIQKAVADYYGLKVTQLKTRNNAKEVALPRHVAMYLSKELTGCSLPDIGRRFGGKHHSTVIHAVRKISMLRENQPEFDRQIRGFLESFQ